MAIYVKNHRLLFIQTPGTASTATEQALIRHGGVPLGGKHATLADITAETDNAEIHFEISIACVRNPYAWLVAEWERLRSVYVWELERPNSYYSTDVNKRHELLAACAFDFNRWTQHIYIDYYEMDRTASRDLFARWTQGVSQIFRYEDIESHMVPWFSDVLGEELKIEAVNVSRGAHQPPYWTHYSSETRRLVETLFAPTLDRYGYRF